jgi:hypothetical protein
LVLPLLTRKSTFGVYGQYGENPTAKALAWSFVQFVPIAIALSALAVAPDPIAVLR